MIDRWNEVVGRKDTVYILGDFSLGLKAGEAKQIALFLNEHKHLVLGNHDKRNAPWYRDVFGLVTPYTEVHDQVDGFRRNVVLSHYFIPFYPQARYMGFMLHGHTHTRRQKVITKRQSSGSSATKGCAARRTTSAVCGRTIDRRHSNRSLHASRGR